MANDAVNLCGRCKSRPRKKHFNSKWCGLCAQALKHRPAHRLTKSEQVIVRRLAGTMRRDEIAQKIGRSLAAIVRFCRDEGISLMYDRDYSEAERRMVCEYYLEHGKIETQKKFPHIKVRSIVDRYLKNYGGNRQIRWTDAQLLELARMGGIISPEAQAKYFNRPRAHAGSINSAWVKRMRITGGIVPGLKAHRVYPLVRGGKMVWNREKRQSEIYIPFDPLELPFWRRSNPGRNAKREAAPRKIYLWVDIAAHVRRDLPSEIKGALRAMARFQRWLYGTRNVRHAIGALIRHREIQ